MQFTTVRSKEKDYDIYLKSEKLVHSKQEQEKNVSQLFGSGKNWFLAISSQTNTVAAIWREKKVIPTTVRSKEKDYDIYLKQSVVAPKKMFPSYLEVEKTGSQLFLASQTLLQLFGERNMLFGDQNMQFTTVRYKEKDYDIYLMSEKLVHSQ